MNRYFLFTFLYIIFLDIFETNASPQNLSFDEKMNNFILCAQSLTNDDPRSRLSFQESIDIPDDEYKRRMLKVFNIDILKVEDVLRIGIIRDTQKQDEMLRSIIGLDDKTISFLRDRGVLDVHPIEYLNFTTLPPANRANIFPNAVISRTNANGYLENVVITRVEGDNVYVRLNEDMAESIISKNDAYQPILVGKQVYYFNPIGIPIRTRIISIRENGQIVIEYPPNESGTKTVNANRLKLKPRRETLTSQPDLSKPITDEILNSIRRNLFEIEELYKSLSDRSLSLINRTIVRNNLVRLNSELMRKLSAEMRKQGIITRLVLEPVNVFNRRVYLLSLVIDGVHENGNKVMLSYWKEVELFNASRTKISLYPSVIGEIELDIQAALDILKKEFRR